MKKTSGPIRLAAACLLLCLLSACIPAGEKPEEAAPPLPLVEDRAGVLAPATVERMERDGAVLRDLTGAEIVVVTVEFLGEGPSRKPRASCLKNVRPAPWIRETGCCFCSAPGRRTTTC